MRVTALAVSALTLLAAAPALAHEKGDHRERTEQHVFRIGPEDFGGPFEFNMMRGGRLGVQVSSMTDELRKAMGASDGVGILVNRVMDDTPAKKAGLEAGDVIVEVAGEPVGDVGDVWKALAGREGDVKVEVIREKRHKTFTVKIDKAQHPSLNVFGADPELKRQIDELQQQIKELQKRLDRLEKK